WISGTRAGRRPSEPHGSAFLRSVDAVGGGGEEITRFYRIFHSARIVGEKLVFRLTRPLTEAQMQALQTEFEDILKGPSDESPGPIPQEHDEHPELPRLILPFNRASFGRLRQLIDFIDLM